MEIHNIDVIVSKLLGPIETSPDRSEAENEQRLSATSLMIDLAHSLVSQLRLMTVFATSDDYYQRSQGEMAQEALRSMRLLEDVGEAQETIPPTEDVPTIAHDFSAADMLVLSAASASTIHKRKLDEYEGLLKLNVRNAAESGIRVAMVTLPTTGHDWNAETEKELLNKFRAYGFSVVKSKGDRAGTHKVTLTW